MHEHPSLSRRIVIAALLAAVFGLTPRPSSARIDPLRFLSDQILRPEVIIVLDTSLSMSLPPGTDTYYPGSECSGHDPDVDKTGDYMCTGHERFDLTTTSTTTCRQRSSYLESFNISGTDRCATPEGAGFNSGTFTSDCSIYDDFDTNAGAGQSCRFGHSSPETSRMFMAKRALRTVLKEFRGSASFGLISLAERGYYRYRRADAATKTTGLYLSEQELKSPPAVCQGTTTVCDSDADCGTGSCGPSSWTKGLGWDNSTDRPQLSFQPYTSGTTYRLLNSDASNPSTAGDSLYRSTVKLEDAPLRDASNLCSPSAPCNYGEGDCNANSDNCAFGLVCIEDAGGTVWSNFSVPPSVNASSVDVCLDPFAGSPPAPNWLGADDSCRTSCFLLFCSHAGEPIGSCSSNAGGCTSGSKSCDTGLQCKENVADNLWPPATAPSQNTVGVCIPDDATIMASSTGIVGKGSFSGEKFVYKRFDWAGHGQQFTDSSGTWTYQGSFYTYTAHAVQALPALTGYCSSGCVNGTYGCSSDSDCTAGVCMRKAAGHALTKQGLITHPNTIVGGFPGFKASTLGVCVSNTDLKRFSRYRGPEYYDGTTTWVYNRFGGGYRDPTTIFFSSYPTVDSYGVSEDSALDPFGGGGGAAGRVVVPLFDAQGDPQQADFDRSLGAIMTALNATPAGGLGGYRFWTQTDYALLTAAEHFTARYAGTAPFSARDPSRDCRPRYVILLSDGECTGSNCDTRLNANATYLFNGTGYSGTNAPGPHGRVQTIAISLPGMPAAGVAQMKDVADCGSDGFCGNCASEPTPPSGVKLCNGFTSNNEAELVKNIRRALLETLRGEYTTAAAGVTTTGSGSQEGNTAVTPYVLFPGWQGHMKAEDVTTSPSTFVWDAGTKLQATNWHARKIYAISDELDSGGSAFPLWTGSYPAISVDVTNVRAAWQGPNVPSSNAAGDAEIAAFVKWLAGKDRSWKLAPIVNAVPASVGPPPAYGGAHGSFETANASRKRLIYVGSNDGLLHAFDAETGVEEFAFISGHHLDLAFQLYKAGGQDDDPTKFRYVLAASPRVEDVYDGSNWRTVLIQNDGPAGEDFYALDITSTNPANLKLLFYSKLHASLNAKFGETWSLPTIFWSNATGTGRVAMGSGYESTVDEGTWYNFFSDITQTWPSTLTTGHATDQQAKSGSAEVDYAVLAGTVATSNSSRVGLETYQADLEGRIYRRTNGTPAGVSPLINVGVTNPIYHSPAVFHDEGGTGLNFLAFASGTYNDTSIVRNGAGLEFKTSSTPFISNLYLYTDDRASPPTVATKMSCAVDSLCTCASFGGNVPGSCVNPSARAIPISSPMLVQNAANGELHALYLLYEPPANQCNGTTVAVGNSYVVQVRLSGATVSLEKIIEHTNVKASALTVIGGGSDIVISTSGTGSGAAGIVAVGGGAITPAPQAGQANIETWREVR
jgi:hypothetical protein